MELNMFTNCTINAPDVNVIRLTYAAFRNTFDPDCKIPVTLWVDPHPKARMYDKYIQNLTRYFIPAKSKNKIVKCESLSDGYIQAVIKSKSKWLFMLEHDWILQKDLITNTLDEITQAMEACDIYHLRFNKRKNIVFPPYDKFLKEYDLGIIKFCATPFLSNNPHIINRNRYLDFIRQKLIQRRAGSKGIEEIISAHQHTCGAIYGGLDYPMTAKHLDGRGHK
jgi:hypothetical protein